MYLCVCPHVRIYCHMVNIFIFIHVLSYFFTQGKKRLLDKVVQLKNKWTTLFSLPLSRSVLLTTMHAFIKCIPSLYFFVLLLGIFFFPAIYGNGTLYGSKYAISHFEMDTAQHSLHLRATLLSIHSSIAYDLSFSPEISCVRRENRREKRRRGRRRERMVIFVSIQYVSLFLLKIWIYTLIWVSIQDAQVPFKDKL